MLQFPLNTPPLSTLPSFSSTLNTQHSHDSLEWGWRLLNSFKYPRAVHLPPGKSPPPGTLSGEGYGKFTGSCPTGFVTPEFVRSPCPAEVVTSEVVFYWPPCKDSVEYGLRLEQKSYSDPPGKSPPLERCQGGGGGVLVRPKLSSDSGVGVGHVIIPRHPTSVGLPLRLQDLLLFDFSPSLPCPFPLCIQLPPYMTPPRYDPYGSPGPLRDH